MKLQYQVGFTQKLTSNQLSKKEKKLYNIYGKKQLKDQLKNENFNRITCSFYNYHIIENLEELRDNLYNTLSNMEVLGRIYLAEEGINAQISVPEESWSDFLDLIKKYDFFENTYIKSMIHQFAKNLKLEKHHIRQYI